MIPNAMIANFEGPRRSYIFPPIDYIEDRPADERQKRILNDLVIQLDDTEERERYLSQICGISSEDAENLIFSLITAKMRII